jgi:hypothetical protein
VGMAIAGNSEARRVFRAGWQLPLGCSAFSQERKHLRQSSRVKCLDLQLIAGFSGQRFVFAFAFALAL